MNFAHETDQTFKAVYEEFRQIKALPFQPRLRYGRLLEILRRICLEETADFQSDFSTLFSMLFALCKAKGIDHRPADRFRRHARQVLHEDFRPDEQAEYEDLADLCFFIEQISGEKIPDDLPHPHFHEQKSEGESKSKSAKVVRAVVASISSPQLFKVIVEGEEVSVAFETRFLHEAAMVALLDSVVDADGIWKPWMVVLEPDYLIDVSVLTACFQPYGKSPLNFLLHQWSPQQASASILLGNAANQFMDECVNEPDGQNLYENSLRKSFKDSLLDYACLSDEEINRSFFERAKILFEHIRQAVRENFPAKEIGLEPKQILLEPDFICPALGLRGRFDVMTEDFRNVLELKSGRAAGMQSFQPRPAHRLQMSLYREILRRNFHFEWDDIRSFLFYARYPKFFDERVSAEAIREALSLRNGILYMKHVICQGQFERLLPLLNSEHLNETGLDGRFFEQFLRPQIERITIPVQATAKDPLLLAYFSAFLTFEERECFLSKTGDRRSDSLRGFSAAWTVDFQSKLQAGKVLPDLRVEECIGEYGVEEIRFILPPYDRDFVPDFSAGQMVQIYERPDGEKNVTNSRLFRGTLIDISADRLTVRLANRQRNVHAFQKDTLFAIEHDASDAPFNQSMRNLFAFLQAEPSRRDLLLGRREPEIDGNVKLKGSYTKEIADVVLQAKQAKDFFLLVGPPGTGKTSIALRAMVKEFLLTKHEPGMRGSLMLTAYTNRAVDEICAMLLDLTEEIPFDFLRLGHEQVCARESRSRLLSSRAANLPNRKAVREMIDATPVVVGTIMTLTNSQLIFRRKLFDALIVDEASQILEPQALGLLSATLNGESCIRKFILIGDHKQLPAVVLLPESQTRVRDSRLQAIGLTDLRNSLFQRLYSLQQRFDRKGISAMLGSQGRMHVEVSAFVNKCFYGNRLRPLPLPHQEGSLTWLHPETPCEQFVASTRMGFVQVSQAPGAENLQANLPEARVVADLVEALFSLQQKTTGGGQVPHIGIIVPFRRQIAAVRNALRKKNLSEMQRLTIDTVECFQGSQRDFIIFSAVVSQPYGLRLISNEQVIEGMTVDRKLNVAVTRARKQFFLVGDARILSQSESYNSLIRQCQTFCPQS